MIRLFVFHIQNIKKGLLGEERRDRWGGSVTEEPWKDGIVYWLSHTVGPLTGGPDVACRF